MGTHTSLSPYPDVVRTSEVAVLPYLPYPTSPVTGCPPATRLPTLQPRRTSQLGALMSDPITGIEVPVLAVTLHPQTRQWLTLGGTYCNPLTKTLAPLELGGPMKDPVTGGIVPILGVGLDEHTGLATFGLFHPVVPVWPGCPISPSLQLPLALARLETMPHPLFPLCLCLSVKHPQDDFTVEVNPRGQLFLPVPHTPLVLVLGTAWPCYSSLLSSFFSHMPCLAYLYYQGSLSYLTF